MFRVLAYLIVFCVIAFVGAIIGLGVYKTDGPHEYAALSPAEQAEAQAYLDANDDLMPEGVEWGWFELAGDVRLETATLAHPAPKGVIVIAPGFTAPLELYGATFEAFFDAGYTVTALSTRGQGRSTRLTANPEKGYIEDYIQLAADLSRYVATFEGPVFVYGNSMGGHIAMTAAGVIHPDVEAYALIVPMAKILTGEFPEPVALAMTGASVAFGFGENYTIGRGDWTYASRDISQPTGCSANPDRAHLRHMHFALDPELRVEGVTNRWVWEAMRSTAKAAEPSFLVRSSKPVLSITAGQDTVVDTAQAQANCAAMQNCTNVHFEAAQHCIMHEDVAQADAVHAEVIAFFDQIGGVK